LKVAKVREVVFDSGQAFHWLVLLWGRKLLADKVIDFIIPFWLGWFFSIYPLHEGVFKGRKTNLGANGLV